MTAPRNESAPEPLEGTNAPNISHITSESATAARMFRDRIAKALFPLETERFQAEIERQIAEARASALLAEGGRA